MSAQAMRLPAITQRAARRATLRLYAGLWLLTALAVLAAIADSTLGSSKRPQPTLHPTITMVISLALSNARVLTPPFLFSLFRFGSSRVTRALADLVVATPLVLVAVTVGAALGRWGGRLIPYVPQLPVEYLAAAAAAGVWVTYGRAGWRNLRELARQAAFVLALILIAAAIEVLATPHAR